MHGTAECKFVSLYSQHIGLSHGDVSAGSVKDVQMIIDVPDSTVSSPVGARPGGI